MFVLIGDIESSLIGGGIVGGAVTIATALWTLYKNVMDRRAKQRQDDVELEKKEIEVKKLARRAVEDEWATLFEARKLAHEEDMRRVLAEIQEVKNKNNELDIRERECQVNHAKLKQENVNLRQQNAEQQKQIDALQLQKEELKKDLKDLKAVLRQCGVPIATGEGSGVHRKHSDSDEFPTDPPKPPKPQV